MKSALSHYHQAIDQIKKDQLFKEEFEISSPQGREIHLKDGRSLINFCANNYLGLGGSTWMQELAQKGLENYGYGMNSVRFICGTQEIHRELEKSLAEFLKFDDTILYSSCFDANAGLFETILGPEDVVISDQLNHASIIDGVRLCKAQRKVYKNADMSELEAHLKDSAEARVRLIATDGVFSMDGTIAPLAEIVSLAERYDALVMVDESHATGVIGDTGRGAIEQQGVMGKVDIVSGTFGKAMGGASGGFICAHQDIVTLLRQRSRPYLFSNSLAPPIAYAQVQVAKKLMAGMNELTTLGENTKMMRRGIQNLGYQFPDSNHPIIPVMFYDEHKAKKASTQLFEEGVYAINFSYPVVPKGKARVRLQVNAIHCQDDIDMCLNVLKSLRHLS